MLSIRDLNLDGRLSVIIAVTFAKDVLHMFESKYPNDMRPRAAIEVADGWLVGTAAAPQTYYAAAADATVAANAAYTDSYAANAACYAAYVAANAANATANASNSADNESNSYYAICASANAANAANAAVAANAYNSSTEKKYTHCKILELLPIIIQYKIENEQSFKSSDKVFEYLSDEDKELFLFNLDILR